MSVIGDGCIAQMRGQFAIVCVACRQLVADGNTYGRAGVAAPGASSRRTTDSVSGPDPAIPAVGRACFEHVKNGVLKPLVIPAGAH